MIKKNFAASLSLPLFAGAMLLGVNPASAETCPVGEHWNTFGGAAGYCAPDASGGGTGGDVTVDLGGQPNAAPAPITMPVAPAPAAVPVAPAPVVAPVITPAPISAGVAVAEPRYVAPRTYDAPAQSVTDVPPNYVPAAGGDRSQGDLVSVDIVVDEAPTPEAAPSEAAAPVNSAPVPESSVPTAPATAEATASTSASPSATPEVSTAQYVEASSTDKGFPIRLVEVLVFGGLSALAFAAALIHLRFKSPRKKPRHL